jgi:hypothetical protein
MEIEVCSPFIPGEDAPRHPIQRIVGARLSEEARQRILEQQRENFVQQERPEWKQNEVSKTAEQQKLLELADQATDELLQQYGREPFHIPSENYHLLDETGRKKLRLGWESGGAYSIKDEAVFMRPEPDPVIFSLIAYHETLHFKSYQALQRLYPGKEVLPYRRGFEIITRHGHRSYFRRLDEAVIQELSNRYIRERISNHSLTNDAVAASEGRRNLILQYRGKLSKKDADFLEQLVPYVAELPDKVRAVFSQIGSPADQVRRAFDDCKYRNLFIHPYADDVRGLHLLIDEIYDRNKRRFENKEEIFKLFVEAVISGNVLPVGRLIDKTFGEASFRRLGKGEEIVPGEIGS